MNEALSIVAREIHAPPVQAQLTRTMTTPRWRGVFPYPTRPPKRSSAAASRRAFACSAASGCASDPAAADLVQDVLLMALQKLRAREVREPDRIASFMLGAAAYIFNHAPYHAGA